MMSAFLFPVNESVSRDQFHPRLHTKAVKNSECLYNQELLETCGGTTCRTLSSSSTTIATITEFKLHHEIHWTSLYCNICCVLVILESVC